MKKNIIVLQVMLLLVTSCFAQEKSASKKGDRHYYRLAFASAIDAYLDDIDKAPESPLIYRNLADSFYENAELIQASVWFSKYAKIVGDEMAPEDMFKLSQCLKAAEKYDESNKWMEKFSQLRPEDRRGISFKKNKSYLKDILNTRSTYKIKNEYFNTHAIEYAPSYYDENTIVFSSSRDSTGVRSRDHLWTKFSFSDLYTAVKNTTGKLRDNKTNVKRLGKKVNSKFNEASAVLTNDGATMYFTRNNYTDKKYRSDESGLNRLKLYRAELVDDKWDNVVELPFNSSDYSVAHPALSTDNKRLYFASDMPGTLGMSDIFYVDILADGAYGDPVNMGAVINTEGRDTYPFISNKGNMYIASDGHVGIGGLDVFVVERDVDDKVLDIKNIGTPVNSSMDDFGFIVDEENFSGYFTSNRKKGRGSDDIYSFEYLPQEELPVVEKCFQTITGVITNVVTGAPEAGANINLVNAKGDVVAEMVTDQTGVYTFENIECGKVLRLNGTKLNYKPDAATAKTTDENQGVVEANLAIKPMIIGNKIVINPIYFDFDKSYIRQDAKFELEDVVTVMQNNPKMVIKIESHTDSRGSAKYNRSLSDRRAKSTRSYLISRGIAPNRIASAIGYGESQLLNHCDDAHRNSCSEEEHQLNRRSYFIIISGAPNVSVGVKAPSKIDRKPGK